MKNTILLIICFVFVFASTSDKTCGDVECVNTVYVSAINDLGDGNVQLTLSYNFQDEVAGFQFDLSSDDIITFDGESLSLDDSLNDWEYTKANSNGSIIGFNINLSTLIGEGTLFQIQGTYNLSHIGESVKIDATENCGNGSGNLAGKCRKADGDTRMVLSTSDATLIELSHFQEAHWTVGTSSSAPEHLNNQDLNIYSYNLSSNYPNPFNPSTTISYSIEVAGVIDIIVYDMQGRKVKTLVSEYATPGLYNITWDAMNNAGVKVSAGMYICKMISGDFMTTNKMLLIK